MNGEAQAFGGDRGQSPVVPLRTDDEVARDLLIQSQPILWAQAMLEEAEKVRSLDARDAILARIGATLYSRFGVVFDPYEMRRSDERWDENPSLPQYEWIPAPPATEAGEL